MKHQINVNVFYRPGKRGHRIKLIKKMSLALNGSVRMGTVVRLLHLAPWALMRLHGEDSAPLELEMFVQDLDEMNLFVEPE